MNHLPTAHTAPRAPGEPICSFGSFEEVVVPEIPHLRARAIGLTRNRADAEDLLQETCLKAWRSFRRFRQGSNCRAWLVTILRNTFITHWRSAGGREPRLHLTPIDDAPEMPAIGTVCDPADPLEALDLRCQEEAVTGLLDTLPPPFRSALRMLIDGLSYREIAAHERVPIGTVMSRLHRARKQAARRLRAYDDALPAV